SVGGDAIGIAQEALGLYNDLTFMKKATDAKAAAEALPPGGDKEKAEAAYTAYLKNIQNADLKKVAQT
ncbi:MAG: hypothetical protein WAL91_04790, partial [Propionicimonas sp.]